MNGCSLDDTGANSDEGVDILVEIGFGNHWAVYPFGKRRRCPV